MMQMFPWALAAIAAMALLWMLKHSTHPYRETQGSRFGKYGIGIAAGVMATLFILAMNDSEPSPAPAKKQHPRGVYAEDGEEIFHLGKSFLQVTVENGFVTYAKFQIHEDLGNGRYQQHFLWTVAPIQSDRPVWKEPLNLAPGVHLYQHDRTEDLPPGFREQVDRLVRQFNAAFPRVVVAPPSKQEGPIAPLDGAPRNFECEGGLGKLSVATTAKGAVYTFEIGTREVHGKGYRWQGGKLPPGVIPDDLPDDAKKTFNRLRAQAEAAGY